MHFERAHPTVRKNSIALSAHHLTGAAARRLLSLRRQTKRENWKRTLEARRAGSIQPYFSFLGIRRSGGPCPTISYLPLVKYAWKQVRRQYRLSVVPPAYRSCRRARATQNWCGSGISSPKGSPCWEVEARFGLPRPWYEARSRSNNYQAGHLVWRAFAQKGGQAQPAAAERQSAQECR